MQISDYFENTNQNSSDKTGLLKSILPFAFEYNKDTQEIEIKGVAINVALDSFAVNEKGALVVTFGFQSPTNAEKRYTFPYYINDCFAPGASEKSVFPTILNLSAIVETFLGRKLQLTAGGKDVFSFNSFQELYMGFLSKITVPTEPIANVLVEFSKELNAYANYRVYNNRCAWISRNVDDLSVDNIAQKKMTLLVPDAPAADAPSEAAQEAPTVVEDVDLDALLG